MTRVVLKYMQYSKNIIKFLQKLNLWVMDQLYKMYPNLIKHMKK